MFQHRLPTGKPCCCSINQTEKNTTQQTLVRGNNSYHLTIDPYEHIRICVMVCIIAVDGFITMYMIMMSLLQMISFCCYSLFCCIIVICITTVLLQLGAQCLHGCSANIQITIISLLWKESEGCKAARKRVKERRRDRKKR